MKQVECKMHYETNKVELPVSRERKRRKVVPNNEDSGATLEENEGSEIVDEVDVDMEADDMDNDSEEEDDGGDQQTLEAGSDKEKPTPVDGTGFNLEEEEEEVEEEEEEEVEEEGDVETKVDKHQDEIVEEKARLHEADNDDALVGESGDDEERGHNPADTIKTEDKLVHDALVGTLEVGGDLTDEVGEKDDKDIRELGNNESEEKAGPLLDYGEGDRQKSKSRGERSCNACGKKFSYLKRLVAHIEKRTDCKEHYINNKIELPISKERITKKERRNFVIEDSTSQDDKETPSEKKESVDAQTEPGSDFCIGNNESRIAPQDLAKNENDQDATNEDKSLQLKNGKPYYPLHLRVKIVRDIEKQVAENIEVVDAICEMSKKDNIDVEIIADMWKRRSKYFELDERRKAKLKTKVEQQPLLSKKGKEILEEVGRERFVKEREEEIIPDKSGLKMEHFENVEDENVDKEPDVIKYFTNEDNTEEDKHKENTEEDKHEENTETEICEEDTGADKYMENTEAEIHEENTDADKYEENTEAEMHEENTDADKYEENTEAKMHEENTDAEKYEENTEAKMHEENTGAEKCEENTEAVEYEEKMEAEKYEENLEGDKYKENTELDKYEERVKAVEKELAESEAGVNNDLGEEAKEMPPNNENFGEQEEKLSPACLKERRDGRGKKKCGICAGCTNLEDCDSCRYFL